MPIVRMELPLNSSLKNPKSLNQFYSTVKKKRKMRTKKKEMEVFSEDEESINDDLRYCWKQ